MKSVALAFALGSWLAPAACRDNVVGPSPAAITEIALDWRCFCRPDGFRYEISLRHDGSATCRGSCPGEGRGTFKGSVDRAEYERLAALLVSEGFFQLQDKYQDPLLQDGDWLATGAVRDGRRKVVWNLHGMAPPNLQRIQQAIDSLRSRIHWVETTH